MSKPGWLLSPPSAALLAARGSSFDPLAMKILCDRQRLLDAFSAIGSIPPQKTTKPVVQHVLARTTDAGLELVATDFELSARIRIDQVDVRQPGELLLPAKETAALLREISESSLSLWIR